MDAKILLILVVLTTAVSSLRMVQRCKSGVWGPTCRPYDPPCKTPGYVCIRQRCCRLPVCPPGSTELGSCNTSPNKQRCPDGFDCIRGFCCSHRNGYGRY